MVTRGTRSTSGMDPRNAPPVGSLVIVAESKPVAEQPESAAPAHVKHPTAGAADRRPRHPSRQPAELDLGPARGPGHRRGRRAHARPGRLRRRGRHREHLLPDRRPAPHAARDVMPARHHPRHRARTRGRSRSCPREERLTLFDLYGADEVFLTGTVCELVPVVMIDDRPVGDGVAGPGWERLLDAYRELVRNETG